MEFDFNQYKGRVVRIETSHEVIQDFLFDVIDGCVILVGESFSIRKVRFDDILSIVIHEKVPEDQLPAFQRKVSGTV